MIAATSALSSRIRAESDSPPSCLCASTKICCALISPHTYTRMDKSASAKQTRNTPRSMPKMSTRRNRSPPRNSSLCCGGKRLIIGLSALCSPKRQPESAAVTQRFLERKQGQLLSVARKDIHTRISYHNLNLERTHQKFWKSLEICPSSAQHNFLNRCLRFPEMLMREMRLVVLKVLAYLLNKIVRHGNYRPKYFLPERVFGHV